jgi:hypothetical protein
VFICVHPAFTSFRRGKPWLKNNWGLASRWRLFLKRPVCSRKIASARACGVWTYEPRQGRKAATVVCFAIAAVTLAPFQFKMKNEKLKMAPGHAVALHF